MEGMVNGIDAIKGTRKVRLKKGDGTRSECSSWETGPRVLFPVPQEVMI